MSVLRTAAGVSLMIMGLGAASEAAAFGSDRAAWLQYLHAERTAANQGAVAVAARPGSAAVQTGRVRDTSLYAMRQGRLGIGHLPQRRTRRQDRPTAHGVLPMTRRGTAPSQQRGVVRQAAIRPQRQIDPRFLPAQVNYSSRYRAGTIVIDTREKYLYLVGRDGTAMRYGVGVGRPGFQWAGTHRVSMKKEWPGWTPPKAMRRRQPELPAYMPGGPNNPLGARALYLGSTLYRIHGSNAPWTIGHEVSSGCIRMRNEDVIDLYGRVKVGTKVVVLR
ncbi:MAG: L,D-transpeptidase [Pseudomonadota bacterium]